MPWKPFSAATNVCRPVAHMASLSAASTASAPELQKNALPKPEGAMPANTDANNARSGSSSSWLWSGARCSWASTAATTSGWRMPRL